MYKLPFLRTGNAWFHDPYPPGFGTFPTPQPLLCPASRVNPTTRRVLELDGRGQQYFSGFQAWPGGLDDIQFFRDNTLFPLRYQATPSGVAGFYSGNQWFSNPHRVYWSGYGLGDNPIVPRGTSTGLFGPGPCWWNRFAENRLPGEDTGLVVPAANNDYGIDLHVYSPAVTLQAAKAWPDSDTTVVWLTYSWLTYGVPLPEPWGNRVTWLATLSTPLPDVTAFSGITLDFHGQQIASYLHGLALDWSGSSLSLAQA